MCNVAGKRSNSPNMECHNAAKYIMFNAYEQFEKLVNNPKISNDVFCGIIGFCIEESKPVVAGNNVYLLIKFFRYLIILLIAYKVESKIISLIQVQN